MTRFCNIMIMLFLSCRTLLYAGENKEFDYEFVQQDTYYSFRAGFPVKCDPDSLIELIYPFKNISNYSSAQAVELVREGDNWYEVTFIYRKFFIFENQSTWRRTLKRNEGKIVFEMISSKNNLSIMPDIMSSTGYYQIIKDKDGYREEYLQECRLKPGLLKAAFIDQAKKEAIKFLQEFKEYVERNCD